MPSLTAKIACARQVDAATAKYRRRLSPVSNDVMAEGLTGHGKTTAEAAGRALHIDQVIVGVLPKPKQRTLSMRERRHAGERRAASAEGYRNQC